MSIVLTTTSGPDSKLHLEIPVDRPSTEFAGDVSVRLKQTTKHGWPHGYSKLFNSIDDETFTVHP